MCTFFHNFACFLQIWLHQHTYQIGGTKTKLWWKKWWKKTAGKNIGGKKTKHFLEKKIGEKKTKILVEKMV